MGKGGPGAALAERLHPLWPKLAGEALPGGGETASGGHRAPG